MPADPKLQPTTLDEHALDDVAGGIAMLLPAVQAAREAARRSTPSGAGVIEFQDGDDLFLR